MLDIVGWLPARANGPADIVLPFCSQGYAELLQQLQRPTALVLPAFEIAASDTEGKELALAVARGEAAALPRR